MRKLLAWSFAALAMLALAETVISLIHSDQWWIQILNFPRLLSIIAVGLIAIGCAVFAHGWRWGTVLVPVLVIAAALQFWRIYPYVPFAPIEVVEASALPGIQAASCFKALGLNVFQHNRQYDRTIRLIEREQPDIMLLMETDDRWVKALTPVLKRYPHRLLRPIDNTYGLVFASKLPVRSAHTENITDQNTPTVYAELTARDGQRFDYIGLHPRPPLPGQDTDLRDRKIEHAALRIAGHRLPAMAMGDFNDVAWSRTTQLFKQVGGYLDPRIGRGSYPSFPAKYAPVGWPLDQMFVSRDFAIRSLHILEDVGADHRPLMAQLCLAPQAARPANAAPDTIDPAARRAARTMTRH